MSATRRALVLGASGMLGNAMLRVLSGDSRYAVLGTVRTGHAAALLPAECRQQLLIDIDVLRHDDLVCALETARPDVVVNCVGIVKQLADADDPLEAIPVNSLLPHRLARLCKLAGARLIHLSTDCVFSGSRGMYVEDDKPDANDLYGRTKLLGEVTYPHTITLRTSIIGHELAGCHSLINWFLAQSGSVEGFSKAVFSGLPTVELARVIKDHVIPNESLCGLYHVSAAPISKFELLHLVAKAYGKEIEIKPSDEVVIDRSLDSSKFRQVSGFSPKAWPDLVQEMRSFK